MTHIQIKSRWTDRVLFEGEYTSTRRALESAVKAGANLAGANLADANLADANLAGAYLADANLAGAYLARANLDGANLDGAYLARAYLARANLDGETIYIAPLQISGLRWFVTITPKYLKIGCKRHTHEEWKAFKRTDISAMDKGAWGWWKCHKSILLGLAAIHRKDSAEAERKAAA